MTEQDKLFITTHKAWEEATQLNIEEHQLNIRHNQEKISLLEKMIKNDTDNIMLSSNYLKSGKDMFAEWCEQNKFNPSQDF